MAIPHLSRPEPELHEYAEALADRFANPAIRHLLAQIAADGSQKLPVRVVPALRAASQAGAHAADGELDGGLRAIAAWVLHARGAGAPLVDAEEARVRELVSGGLAEALTRVLRHWGLDLGLAVRAQELAAEVSVDAADSSDASPSLGSGGG